MNYEMKSGKDFFSLKDCWREVEIGDVKLRWISPALRLLLFSFIFY
jgi:hypothetical protein